MTSRHSETGQAEVVIQPSTTQVMQIVHRQPQIYSTRDHSYTPSPHLGRKLWTSALFVIATVTSPCCSPLVVVLLVTVAAGTPLAAWVTQNLAWIYGGLTAISILSFIVGISRLRQKKLLARMR